MQKKVKVGILTFGDGREFLKKDLEPINAKFQKRLKDALVNDGFEVVAGEEVIWNNRLAVKYGKMMQSSDVDCVIFNYCVWAWPGFARVAAQFCPKPLVLYADLNPGFPAMVGMLANAGSLDQTGIPFTKIFGDLTNSEIYGRLKSSILGISAFNRLKGMRGVTVMRSGRVKISPADNRRAYVQIDGVLGGTLPAEIRIVPDALTLLVPDGYGG